MKAIFESYVRQTAKYSVFADGNKFWITLECFHPEVHAEGEKFCKTSHVFKDEPTLSQLRQFVESELALFEAHAEINYLKNQINKMQHCDNADVP